MRALNSTLGLKVCQRMKELLIKTEQIVVMPHAQFRVNIQSAKCYRLSDHASFFT